MTDSERLDLLRRYASGDVTWHALRERGFEDYVEVPGGPNAAARERGRALLRRALWQRA